MYSPEFGNIIPRCLISQTVSYQQSIPHVENLLNIHKKYIGILCEIYSLLFSYDIGYSNSLFKYCILTLAESDVYITMVVDP